MYGALAVERVPLILRDKTVELIEVYQRRLGQFDEFDEFTIESVHMPALPHLMQPHDC